MFDRERALKSIKSGHCVCAGCDGQLTDPDRSRGGWGFCRICRCAWRVSTVDQVEYAATIPSPAHVAPAAK